MGCLFVATNSLIMTGAAYDTEKEFDTMFAAPPYVNEYENDWKWTFNTQFAPFDFVELSARLRYPCFHLRWDVSQQRQTDCLIFFCVVLFFSIVWI